MTNAHSIEYGKIVQVRRRGGDSKFECEIEAIGNECDLALLRVVEADEAAFFEGLRELKFGPLPELQDEVDVLGFPVGGESMSVTSGVVSRVEMQEYSQAGQSLLALQIDAAINPGNSGGPVVDENLEVVGVAFQSLNGDDVENIGYVVPVTVVEHFLEDIRRNAGQYTGWCALGIGFSLLESKSFREYLGMQPGQTGVMVHELGPSSSAFGHLELNDVLLSVDEVVVANDGTIPFRRGERVALSHYISSHFAGDVVEARVLRGGDKLVEVPIPLKVARRLVPYHWARNSPPPYLVVSGLVFTALSVPYLEAERCYDGRNTPDQSYLLTLEAAGSAWGGEAGEEVVVLSSVLCHRSNLGYESLENLHLGTLNGRAVRSVEHLSQLVEENTEPFLRFEFKFSGKVVVLDAQGVAAATAEICEENGVPRPMRFVPGSATARPVDPDKTGEETKNKEKVRS